VKYIRGSADLKIPAKRTASAPSPVLVNWVRQRLRKTCH